MRAPGGATSSHAHWQARAGLGTRGMGRTERGTRGPAWWRVADVEAPRLAQGGGSRWSGDAASTVGSAMTCSSARLWPASAAFRTHQRVHLCLAAAGGVNNGKVALDALCALWKRVEVEREGKCCCPERKNESMPPLNHCLGQQSMQEVEEEQVRPWEKVELMEISGRG